MRNSLFISSLRRLTRRMSSGLRMNRFERHPQPAVEAELEYRDGDYRVRKAGAFVRCAVTGEPIPLEDLRYWSIDRQEPYSSPEARMKLLLQEIKGRKG
jgi:hypothetical protein